MAVNSVTPKEATLVRATARDGLYGEFVYPSRIWMPVEYTEASGRAKCRLCREPIEKGVRCIAFGFDVYCGMDHFSRIQRAYLHTECQPKEENDGAAPG